MINKLMEGFRQFYEQTKEQEENLKATLRKLPASHQALVAPYKIKWHNDNTLQGDDGHVGIVNPQTKTITIAAPWRYGREHTFLHELAHKVWERFVAPNPMLVKRWHEIVANTKNKMKQNDEELFCHGYAAAYGQNPPMIHYHKDWVNFIKELRS
jgi:hypothetical protein